MAFDRIDDADVTFVEDTSLPGFTDVLGDSWDFLVTVVAVLVLAFAAVVPFLWIVPLVWFVRRWWIRRNRPAQVPPAPPAAPLDGTDPEPEPAPEQV